MTESHTRPVGAVLAERIRSIRKMRALTQAQLVERLRELGDDSADQATISRIEKPHGTAAANLSVHKLLLLASALNVAPVYLLSPDGNKPEDPEIKQRVYIHRGAELDGVDLRYWFRGHLPLPGADEHEFFTAVPWGEWDEMTHEYPTRKARWDELSRKGVKAPYEEW